MNEDRIRNDQFRFDNKVWDEIESVAENEGADDAGEEEADEEGTAAPEEETGVVDRSALDSTGIDEANDPLLIEAPSLVIRADEPAVDATGGSSTELLDALQSLPGRGYMTSPDAFFWVMSFTRHPHHKLFTVMTEEEWGEALDPDSSLDTMETLQALREIIAPPPV